MNPPQCLGGLPHSYHGGECIRCFEQENAGAPPAGRPHNDYPTSRAKRPEPKRDYHAGQGDNRGARLRSTTLSLVTFKPLNRYVAHHLDSEDRVGLAASFVVARCGLWLMAEKLLKVNGEYPRQCSRCFGTVNTPAAKEPKRSHASRGIKKARWEAL